MRQDVTEIIGTVGRQLLLGEVGWPGHTFPGVNVPTLGIRISVFIAYDAAVPPPLEKSARVDTILTRAVAIKVVRALPGQNCREMRRPHRGHEPLPRRIIGNAEQANLPAAPGSCARPFNGIVEVAKLRRGIRIKSTR